MKRASRLFPMKEVNYFENEENRSDEDLAKGIADDMEANLENWMKSGPFSEYPHIKPFLDEPIKPKTSVSDEILILSNDLYRNGLIDVYELNALLRHDDAKEIRQGIISRLERDRFIDGNLIQGSQSV